MDLVTEHKIFRLPNQNERAKKVVKSLLKRSKEEARAKFMASLEEPEKIEEAKR